MKSLNTDRFILSSDKILAFVILIVGLSISTFVSYHIQLQTKTSEEIRFNHIAEAMVLRVQERMDTYAQVLLSGVGLFASSDNVTRQEWHDFIAELDLDNKFPGIQGIGYNAFVLPKDKEKHIQKIRAEGFPEYTIKPEGERKIYTSIDYIEPFNERNKKAFGYDTYSNPVRKKAMDMALQSGKTVLTDKVRLAQENNIDEQAGFIMYAPIYKNGLPTSNVLQRQNAVIGFISAPFRAKNLMNGILGGRYKYVDIEIYDGHKVDQNSLLFDSNIAGFNSNISYITTIDLYGTTWTIRLRPLKEFFDETNRNESMYAFILGTTITIAIFMIFVSLSTNKEKAQELADKMTVEFLKEKNFVNAVFDSSISIIAVIDKHGRMIRLNSYGQEFTGYSQEELATKPFLWKIFLSPEQRDGIEKIFKEAKKGNIKHRYENYWSAKSGNTRLFDWFNSIIYDSDGEFEYLVTVGVDITDKKAYEEHLQHLVQQETSKRLEQEKLLLQQSRLAMMGEMIGAIAHQWRQPLNALAIQVQDTYVAYSLEEINEEYMSKFQKDSMSTIKRMSQTIDDFRNFFKPNKEKNNFAIETAIKRTIDIMEPMLKNHSITLEFESSGEHSIFGYQNETEQAIMIMISNAQDALMHNNIQDPKIKITLQNIDNNKIQLSIHDNAGGVPESIIDRIFEPYFTTKHQAQGTGIGLYMAKEIIERQMGGKLYVENVNGGARFVVEV